MKPPFIFLLRIVWKKEPEIWIFGEEIFDFIGKFMGFML